MNGKPSARYRRAGDQVTHLALSATFGLKSSSLAALPCPNPFSPLFPQPSGRVWASSIPATNEWKLLKFFYKKKKIFNFPLICKSIFKEIWFEKDPKKFIHWFEGFFLGRSISPWLDPDVSCLIPRDEWTPAFNGRHLRMNESFFDSVSIFVFLLTTVVQWKWMKYFLKKLKNFHSFGWNV